MWLNEHAEHICYPTIGSTYPIDISTILCHTKSMIKTNTGYASNSYLASIMDECIAAERAATIADRQAREAGATYGVVDIDIHPDLNGDDYADAVLASL